MRRAAVVIFTIFLASVSGLPGISQPSSAQDDFHRRVVALYSFSPHTLSKEQRSAKSDEMDAFWKGAKRNPGATLPLLRVELGNSSDPAFFAMDGSALLMDLSKDANDKALVARAMPRVDFADVTRSAYFYAVHSLSMDGIDTTAAALHVLDDPKFAVPLPQHAMTLDQQSVLLYLLLPVSDAKWMTAAVERFAEERDETAQKSLIGLFFYSQTLAGDKAVAEAAADTNLSEAVRSSAKSYLADAKEALRHTVDIKGTEAEVREARRKRLNAVSDESIEDVQAMTARLVQLRQQVAPVK